MLKRTHYYYLLVNSIIVSNPMHIYASMTYEIKVSEYNITFIINNTIILNIYSPINLFNNNDIALGPQADNLNLTKYVYDNYLVSQVYGL